jgi:hypothetical protein
VYAVRGSLFDIYHDAMERRFRSVSFRNPVRPDTAVSGFIYTNLDEGEKVVHIDLIATEQVKFFTFFVRIPGMRVDYGTVDFSSLYSEDEVVDTDEYGLRAALEALPCCTTDREGSQPGDPLNWSSSGNSRTLPLPLHVGAGFRPKKPIPPPSGRPSSPFCSGRATVIRP